MFQDSLQQRLEDPIGHAILIAGKLTGIGPTKRIDRTGNHSMLRGLFVTNFCPHYHVELFEMLSASMELEFLFTSRGEEWYWDPRHGTRTGRFSWRYVSGRQSASSISVALALLRLVSSSKVDLVFSSLLGRLPFLAAFLAAKAKGIPFVLWSGIWMHPATPMHRFSFPLLRVIYKASDAIVVYGTHVRDYLVSLGVPHERIFVSYHALDNLVYNKVPSRAETDRLRLKHDLRGGPVVLFVGRLTESKGVNLLVEAVALLGDIRPVLVFVGEGELKASLEEQSAIRDVDVRFVGYVSTEELYVYYALADVFVLPSVTVRQGREPWGLVVNEAMNQRAPVIVSKAVGAAAGGLVRHGKTGLVVPEGDVDALASSMRTVLTDRSLALRLGNAAGEEIVNWNNGRMVAAFSAAAEYAVRVARH